ncbi:MAG: response regulator transcription factor [Desulfobacteraceae bacterium]|nr:response regulator transcription factor [Desulfobacteraceae bacterium]
MSRILIVEDHPVFSSGLKELINNEPDLEVCGESPDVYSAWEKVMDLKPDMVIVDIILKGPSGIELIRDINKRFKAMPVLVLSMHDESLYAERALSAGARGYIMKQEASESIVQAVRMVLAGEIYASKKLTHSILNSFVRQSAHPDESIKKLTNRELEVLSALAEGLNTKQIARKLNLSMKTIGTYRERIKEKLGLKNASELIRYAVKMFERTK